MRDLGEGQFGKVLLMKAQVTHVAVALILLVYMCCLCVCMLHKSKGPQPLKTAITQLCNLHIIVTVLFITQQGIAGYKGELPVAVKTLSSREPEMVARFMEEAELMKKFSHPNIVSLLGKTPFCLCL